MSIFPREYKFKNRIYLSGRKLMDKEAEELRRYLHPVGFFRLPQSLDVVLRDEVAWLLGLHPLTIKSKA